MSAFVGMIVKVAPAAANLIMWIGKVQVGLSAVEQMLVASEQPEILVA